MSELDKVTGDAMKHDADYYRNALTHEPKSTRALYERYLAQNKEPAEAYRLAVNAYSDGADWRDYAREVWRR